MFKYLLLLKVTFLFSKFMLVSMELISFVWCSRFLLAIVLCSECPLPLLFPEEKFFKQYCRVCLSWPRGYLFHQRCLRSFSYSLQYQVWAIQKKGQNRIPINCLVFYLHSHKVIIQASNPGLQCHALYLFVEFFGLYVYSRYNLTAHFQWR